jgi:hypothetical protein
MQQGQIGQADNAAAIDWREVSGMRETGINLLRKHALDLACQDERMAHNGERPEAVVARAQVYLDFLRGGGKDGEIIAAARALAETVRG